MKKIVILAILTFLLALVIQKLYLVTLNCQKEASRWVHVGIGLDDTEVFYDKTRVTKTDNIAYVVMRQDMPDERPIDSKYSSLGSYKYILTTLKINCEDNTVDEGVAKYYDKNVGLGFKDHLVSGPEHVEGFVIDPGTNISKLEEITCKVK